MFCQLIRAIGLFVLIGLGALPSAFGFGSANYAVYEKATNGVTTFYIVPSESIAIIHGDVATPIMFMPDTSGVSVTLNSDGSFSDPQSIQLNANDIDAAGDYTLTAHTASLTDHNNDGTRDFMLEGVGAGSNVIISGDPETPSILWQRVVLDPVADGPDAFVQPAHDDTVGAIASTFDVDAGGNAVYTVPIQTPPGLGGIEPSLALIYNSGAAQGMIGMGWSLAGLSVIHRCSTTLERDRYIDGVDFDSNDKLCLDGQRLATVGLSEYRTENDQQARITGSGGIDSSGAPQIFQVLTRDGKILTYGGNANARILAHGRSDTYVWALNRVRDRYNNEMTITYEQETTHTEYRPKRIDYSANTATGVGPYHSVRFEYSTKSFSVPQYASGALMKGTKLLTNIKSYTGDTLKRNYIISYLKATTAQRPAVRMIVECSGSGHCLRPTTMEWQSTEFDFGTQYTSSLCANSSACDQDNYPYIYYPDVNGDAISDFCYRSDTGIQCYLGDGSGGWGTHINTTICANNSKAYGECDDADNYDTITFVDVDSDGRSDLVFRSDSGLRVFKSTGTYFALFANSLLCAAGDTCDHDNYPYIQYPDINGDALLDFCYRGDTGIQCYLGDGNGGWDRGTHINTTICANNSTVYGGCDGVDNYKTIAFIDVNNDGMSDLVFRSDAGLTVFESTGSGFTYMSGSALCKATTACDQDNYPYIQYPDINGDAIPDFCYRGDTGIQCYLGDGAGGWRDHINTTICANDSTEWGECDSQDNYSTIRFVDFNNDGLSDLMFRSDAGMVLFRSIGAGFVHYVSSGICSAGHTCDYDNYSTSSTPDFNGDGQLDFIYRGDTGMVLYMQNDYKPLLLKAMVNGFGDKVDILYSSMANPPPYLPSVYVPGSAYLGYPLRHVLSGTDYLVHVTYTSDGLGTSFRRSYQYEELRTHLSGLGSLGFAKITTTDSKSLITTVGWYNQNYGAQTHGSLDRVQSIAANRYVISDTRNTWATTTHGTGSNRYYWRNLTKTTVQKFDLNGALLHREANDYTYEPLYNTLETLTSKVYDSAATLVRTTTTTNSDFTNNTGNWLIGLIGKVTVDIDVADQTPAKKITTWEYHATTGRILKEKILAPDGTTVLHETRHEDIDNYGHSLRTVVTGADFATRQSTKIYDDTGRYITDQTNNLGHTVSHKYYSDAHINAGQLATSKDISGLVKRYHYDAFGRTIKVTTADGRANPVSSYTSFQHCFALSDCPTNAKYRITTSSDGGSGSHVYIDLLGRELRKSAQLMDGTFTVVDYYYNGRGHKNRVTEPYRQGSTASHWTDITYDYLGRPISTTNPDGTTDTINYNGLITTSSNDVNGKNQQKIETQNALGQLISVKDNDANEIQYEYDSLGNMTVVTDAADNATHIVYDALGRKTSINDHDKGQWQYTYNGLGQLISQTNAREETTCMAYDTLGRMIKRIDHYQGNVNNTLGGFSDAKNQCANDDTNPETAQWIYDTAPGNATGKLHTVTAPGGYSEIHEYDSYGRQDYFRQSANSEDFEINTAYDAYHRVQITTYPGASNRLGVTNVYNNLGYPVALANAANGQPYYQVTAVDERGNITGSTLGNGISVVRQYQADTGFIKKIQSFDYFDSASNPTIQNLVVSFDSVGNLLERNDTIQNISETFEYDTLNRLKNTAADFGNGDIRTTTITYDALGNIKTKTGVGTYTYGGTCNGQTAGPHAVTGISGTKSATYCYDANGNMISGDGRTMTYSYFDKPTVISNDSHTSSFKYNAARNLYYREDQNNNGTTKTTFVGGIYEKVKLPDNTFEERHYIGGFGIITIKNRTQNSAGTLQERYLHKDHLGSTTLITDEYANIVEVFSFDPWGKRRAPNLQAMIDKLGAWDTLTLLEKNNLTIVATLLSSTITNRGFTGHEQLDGVGLIHMGGRVYDPEIGRFLSADPFVQDRTNLQALNRYSYVQNNPLSYTDPSGYFLKKLFKKVNNAVKTVIMKPVRELQRVAKAVGRFFNKNPTLQAVTTAVAAIYCPVCRPYLTYANMAVTAARTYAAGGSGSDILKNAAISGAATYISMGIPGGTGTSESIISDIMRGVAAKASGGDFIDGVKGNSEKQSVGAAAKSVLSSLVDKPADSGSVVAQKGGQQAQGTQGNTQAPVFMNDQEVVDALNTAWAESNPNAPSVPRGQPGSLKVEQGGWIVKRGFFGRLFNKSDYKVIRVRPGTRSGITLYGRPSKGLVGWFHTHPNTVAEGYSLAPSPADINLTQNFAKVPGVVVTSQGFQYISP